MTHSLLNLITADTYGVTIAKQVIPSQPPKKTLATTTKKTFFFSLFVVLQWLELAKLYKKRFWLCNWFSCAFRPLKRFSHWVLGKFIGYKVLFLLQSAIISGSNDKKLYIWSLSDVKRVRFVKLSDHCTFYLDTIRLWVACSPFYTASLFSRVKKEDGKIKDAKCF